MLESKEVLIARQSPEAQAILRVLRRQFAKLAARAAELESRLGQSLRNASRPPSSQHPQAKLPQKNSKSGSNGDSQPQIAEK